MNLYSKADATAIMLEDYPHFKFECKLKGSNETFNCNLIKGELVVYRPMQEDKMDNTPSIPFEEIYLPF